MGNWKKITMFTKVDRTRRNVRNVLQKIDIEMHDFSS